MDPSGTIQICQLSIKSYCIWICLALSGPTMTSASVSTSQPRPGVFTAGERLLSIALKENGVGPHMASPNLVDMLTSSASICSDTDDHFPGSILSSFAEESFSELQLSDFDDGPELNIESIHTFIASSRHQIAGVPKAKILARISGTGLAPWEIHRPQKFVRDLVLRGCFSGRVLDAGCGIGDNALFVAKACPGADVVAVDVAPRCLEFAAAKAGIRGMRSGLVSLEVANLLEHDPARLPAALGPAANGTFDVVLDSSTFHNFGDADRVRYVATLHRLLRPGGGSGGGGTGGGGGTDEGGVGGTGGGTSGSGGVLYLNCMSEEETCAGGPRRVTVPELLSVFCPATGWQVEAVEDSVVELHPTFWGGKGKARLVTVRKL